MVALGRVAVSTTLALVADKADLALTVVRLIALLDA